MKRKKKKKEVEEEIVQEIEEGKVKGAKEQVWTMCTKKLKKIQIL
jgi:hypothetical protein